MGQDKKRGTETVKYGFIPTWNFGTASTSLCKGTLLSHNYNYIKLYYYYNNYYYYYFVVSGSLPCHEAHGGDEYCNVSTAIV
jgi:hypothetical protein